MNLMKSLLSKRLIRYGIMACFIVGIELVTFQLIYLVTTSYYTATVISFVVGVILNWIIGRTLIFDKVERSIGQEFILVAGASLIGVGIQLAIVSISVQIFQLYPLIGKILSIGFSFFWNYWFREHFVYKQKTKK